MNHSQPVFMNAGQCRLIGSRLETIAFNPDFYHRPFLVSSMEEELKRRMIWFAVVICHQTYALGDPKLNLFGWDYLEHGFLNIASRAPHLLDPTLLVEASQPHLADEIAKWFSPDGSVDNSTLDRREERVRLMVASARFLVDNHQATVGSFLVSTQNTLQGHPMAYYPQLAAVEPFADPLLKKATFMLKLFGDAALFSVTDTGHLIPVMDYHMQRVLLRTGCVQVTDGGLLARLTQRQPLDSDSAIRNAAVEAMAEIARVSRLPVLQMNDVFYMLGRSCCLEKPLCKEAKCDKSPCSLTLALKLPDHSRCLFAGICQGETDDVLRKLWHPVVKTHYY